MIKVAFDSGPLTSGHSFRGIGVMVKEQIKAIEGSNNKEIKFEAFDFSSDEGKFKLENGDYDIIHYPTFFPYSLTLPASAPLRRGKPAKIVVTIQDLIHLIYPDKYPPGIKGKLKFLKQKARLKNVDVIITISETSKKDIVRLLGVSPEKVKVVYLAPSPIYKVIKDKKILEKVKRKYNLPDKFVFNLGDINYNKNIPTLIKACEIADIPLVLGGKQSKEIEDLGLINLMNLSGPMDYMRFLFNIPHPEHAHYSELLTKFNNNSKILRLGFIPDEDVAAIYNLANVYCQPSYYEGFGLSVIHSFACGIPVVISKTNALTEIAGGAALVADPNDPNDMADKITKLLADKMIDKEMISKGSERIKGFSSEKMGKEMVEVYKEVTSS